MTTGKGYQKAVEERGPRHTSRPRHDSRSTIHSSLPHRTIYPPISLEPAFALLSAGGSCLDGGKGRGANDVAYALETRHFLFLMYFPYVRCGAVLAWLDWARARSERQMDMRATGSNRVLCDALRCDGMGWIDGHGFMGWACRGINAMVLMCGKARLA